MHPWVVSDNILYQCFMTKQAHGCNGDFLKSEFKTKIENLTSLKRILVQSNIDIQKKKKFRSHENAAKMY